MEILDLKNIISKTKMSKDRLNNRMERTKERINEQEEQ